MPLRPFADLATGIYVDQRATRCWLRERCSGARVLNLFAYTGLFSLSLLDAGAAEAHDVDLAAPALHLAQRGAELNRVADRHHVHRCEVRAFLEHAEDRYDIVICDPPTAAQGGRGWVARRDYPDLLRALAPRLAAGGLLVAVSNTLGRRFDLRRAVAAALPAGGASPAPDLGDDLPQLVGFPEGRPHRVVAWRVPR